MKISDLSIIFTSKLGKTHDYYHFNHSIRWIRHNKIADFLK